MTVNLSVPTTTHGPAEWAASISDIWTTAAETFVAVGRELIDAKASLPHGEFQAMIETDLPFGPRTANRLMAIAEDRRIADRTHGSDLPASWRTLYELTRLDDDALAGAFEAGKITTDMARGDVRKIGLAAAAGAGGGGAGVIEAAACAVEELAAMAAAGTARFGAIYADPAWTFDTYSAKGKDRSAERHYPTMTDEEIGNLPIKEIAADDCVLFLWCPAPKLEDVHYVLDQWGFRFKTMGFTWVKQNPTGGGLWRGMGFWTRANPEFCLLATRGAPKRLAGATDVDELVVAPVREHSRKPAEVRRRITRLVGGPYMELFAQSRAKDWDAWGAEVGKFGFDDDQADDAAARPRGSSSHDWAGKLDFTTTAKTKAPAEKKAPAKRKAKPRPPAKPPIKYTGKKKPSPDLARIKAAPKGDRKPVRPRKKGRAAAK